jgi:hypothetical protein
MWGRAVVLSRSFPFLTHLTTAFADYSTSAPQVTSDVTSMGHVLDSLGPVPRRPAPGDTPVADRLARCDEIDSEEVHLAM